MSKLVPRNADDRYGSRGRTKEVARGQFVEMAREGEDAVWTVLCEFADLAHNTIAQPDRAVNNNVIWTADFLRPTPMARTSIILHQNDGKHSPSE